MNEGSDTPNPDEKRRLKDLLIATWNAELETFHEQQLRPKITASLKAAAATAAQDGGEALKLVASGVGAWQAQLDQWNEACGERRRSPNLVATVQGYQHLRDDIVRALHGELPGQQPPALPGDEWKDAE